MRRLPRVWRKQMSDSDVENVSHQHDVVPLTADDAHRIRPGWTSRFDRPDIRNVVGQYPDISQWIPETGEYLIAGPWRHRNDVSTVMELSAQHGGPGLLSAFADASKKAGQELALLSEHQESRNPRLYERAGFDFLEHILIYELPSIPEIDSDRFRLKFREMLVVRDDDLEALMELDHIAFPWLWWNSEGEFLNYGRARGVKIYGGFDEHDRLVSYVGITLFRAWGHLDRIAVRPELQGQGIGLESLDWSIFALAQGGAKRIGLSTQARNERSRYMYERYGFERKSQQDYYLYGVWLQDTGSHLD